MNGRFAKTFYCTCPNGSQTSFTIRLEVEGFDCKEEIPWEDLFRDLIGTLVWNTNHFIKKTEDDFKENKNETDVQ